MTCTCNSFSHRRTANRSRAGAVSPRQLSTKGFDILRRVRFAPYRKGHGPTFALTMWDTHRTDGRDQAIIGYRLVEHTVAGKAHVLFAGEDFRGSPMHTSDSDAIVRGLMESLTLRPGDTDREHFANYTPAQMAFATNHAEALSMAVMDRYPNEQEKRERREYGNRAVGSSAPVSTHKYGAHAITSRGVVLGEWTGDNLRAVMAEGDRRFPKGGKAWSVSVRSDRTSDGTVWGAGQGSLVAVREPRTLDNGVFHNDWIVY